MRSTPLAIIISLFGAIAAFPAVAQSEAATQLIVTATDAYRQCSERSRQILVRSLQLRQNQGFGEVDLCVAKNKAAVQPLFETTRSALSQKPAALDAIKDFYALWLTVMGTVVPDLNGENSQGYFNRIKEQQLRLEEKANRARIEI